MSSTDPTSGLMYLAMLEKGAPAGLLRLVMVPLQARKMRLRHAHGADTTLRRFHPVLRIRGSQIDSRPDNFRGVSDVGRGS